MQQSLATYQLIPNFRFGFVQDRLKLGLFDDLSIVETDQQHKIEAMQAHFVEAAIGPVAAISASYAALEIIKYLTGISHLISPGRINYINTHTYELVSQSITRRLHCKFCSNDNNEASHQ